jgi:hypothetical protein
VAVAYLLWALSLVGLCGIHRFYNRKPLSGTLWLVTFGFCGIGQVVDLFLMQGMVEQANQPLLLQEALAAHPAAGGASAAGAGPQGRAQGLHHQ